ncbi:MAG TPA: YqhA family protein [Acidimicrobiales bacterium]|nr:YqhA family protein [Acidimicrobiales bacterium]
MATGSDEHTSAGVEPTEDTPKSELHGPAAGRSRFETGFERLLGASRLLVMIPVAVLVAVALGAFAYGAYYFGRSVRDVIEHPGPAAANISGFLTVIDLFLIGATMLIAAIGFYELFVSRVDPPGARPLPPWLLMQDLNDLKARVIAMIVLVAAVSFIEVLVDFRTGREVLELGIGVAVVIAALTGFLRFGSQKRGEG